MFQDLLELVRSRPPEAFEDLAAFILLAMGQAVGPSALSPQLLLVLDRFAERAGVVGEDRAADVRKKIVAYFDAHPLDPELKAELERSLKRALTEENKESARRSFARFLGEAAPPISNQPPRGALARTLLQLRADKIDR